jgi:integrase
MTDEIRTDQDIAALQATGKRYKRFVGGGLYIEVLEGGARRWRLKIGSGKDEARPTIGEWPEMQLHAAQRLAAKLKNDSTHGIDVVAELAAERSNTGGRFEAEARKWYAVSAPAWSKQYGEQVLRILERDVFPIIGKRRMDACTAPHVLEVIRFIEGRGALDVAADCRAYIEKIFDAAIAVGLCKLNPARDLRGQLRKRVRGHHASVAPADLPDFYLKLNTSNAERITQLGIKAIVATVLREKELLLARRSEIDRERCVLVIPPERMKTKSRGIGPHLVPLPPYAMRLFDEIIELGSWQRKTDWLFPSRKNIGEPVSDGTWLEALNDMGLQRKATVHGFRSTFSTAANESVVVVPQYPVPFKRWHNDWVERQMDHVSENRVRAAYNRAEYLEMRWELMRWWAGVLERAERGEATPTIEYAPAAVCETCAKKKARGSVQRQATPLARVATTTMWTGG